MKTRRILKVGAMVLALIGSVPGSGLGVSAQDTERSQSKRNGQAERSDASSPNREPTCKLPETRDELKYRVDRDQKARFELINSGKQTEGNDSPSRDELFKSLTVIDRENTAWLGEQVEEHGWLGKSLVGKAGAHNAWLLVQHADKDLKFQKKCLQLMSAMVEGEVSGSDIAYLTDRVLSAEGKPQRYGTQCSLSNGKATVKEVEDPDHLNERRASVGLSTIEEYLKKSSQSTGRHRRSRPMRSKKKRKSINDILEMGNASSRLSAEFFILVGDLQSFQSTRP